MTIQDLHSIERAAEQARNMSAQRHRQVLDGHARLRRLRAVLVVPAIVGWAVALQQVMQPDPHDVLTMISALLSVPFLATFQIRL